MIEEEVVVFFKMVGQALNDFRVEEKSRAEEECIARGVEKIETRELAIAEYDEVAGRREKC